MRRIAPTLLLATLLACPARSAEKIAGAETRAILGAGGCDLAGYGFVAQAFSPAFGIPDDNRAYATVGELATVAGLDTLRDVVLEVSLAHTWMGDLVLRLEYVDCLSGVPLHGADILCRPRGANLLAPAPCGVGTSAGCGGNLGTSESSLPPPGTATYFFSDSSATALAEDACPTLAGGGCYRPTVPGAFAGFRGLLVGGCWRLRVADWAESDVGVIDYWAVWTRVQPEVAARPTSWGGVKAIYR